MNRRKPCIIKVPIMSFILMIFFSTIIMTNGMLFGQYRVQQNFIAQGPCYKVIELLIEEYKDDSLAIVVFFNDYEFSGKDSIKATKYNYVSMKNFFMFNKELWCVSKTEIFDKVLIE